MNEMYSEWYQNYREDLLSELEQVFHQPLRSFSLLTGGKYIRSRLFFSANDTTENNIQTAFILELIHAASLIHDDIVDESSLRRGSSTLFAHFGPAKTSALGYYFLAELQNKLLKKNDDFYRLSFSVLQDMCFGQILEIDQQNLHNITQDNYFKRIGLKTASLFRLSCCWINNTIQEEEGDFGYRFGQVFQLLDDIQDYFLPAEKSGKPAFQDNLTGVVTLPVFIAQTLHQENINEFVLLKSVEIALKWLDPIKSRHPKRNACKEQLKLSLQEISSQIGKRNDYNNKSPF